MEDTISRREHEEFARRIDAENERQNKRIALLEDNVRQIGALTASVEKLAVNIENMTKVQSKQGLRLEALEGRDGEKWRAVAAYVLTAVIGVAVGLLFKQIGI